VNTCNLGFSEGSIYMTLDPLMPIPLNRGMSSPPIRAAHICPTQEMLCKQLNNQIRVCAPTSWFLISMRGPINPNKSHHHPPPKTAIQLTHWRENALPKVIATERVLYRPECRTLLGGSQPKKRDGASLVVWSRIYFRC
jgi:hypothetical protein